MSLKRRKIEAYKQTLREEDGHSLPEYIVEAGDNEHLLGGDDIVDQNISQNRAEQADSGCKHYE